MPSITELMAAAKSQDIKVCVGEWVGSRHRIPQLCPLPPSHCASAPASPPPASARCPCGQCPGAAPDAAKKTKMFSENVRKFCFTTASSMVMVSQQQKSKGTSAGSFFASSGVAQSVATPESVLAPDNACGPTVKKNLVPTPDSYTGSFKSGKCTATAQNGGCYHSMDAVVAPSFTKWSALDTASLICKQRLSQRTAPCCCAQPVAANPRAPPPPKAASGARSSAY